MDWKIFFVKSASKEYATCNHCCAEIACKGGSTSGMHKHIKICKKYITQSSSSSPVTKRLRLDDNQKFVQKTLDGYTIKKSLEETVSELAAVDGLTIQQITNSRYIRKKLEEDFGKIPKNKTDVMNLIHNYYEKIKLKIKVRKFKNK
jgi:hypothetical protein